MAARPTVVKARICWKSAVEMARLIDAGLAICSIFGEGGSWGGRIDSGGSCGVVFNASNRFGAPLAGARFFFGFRPRLLGIGKQYAPRLNNTASTAAARTAAPPAAPRRLCGHTASELGPWQESMSRWLCCCRALRRGHIVHAPAESGARSSATLRAAR
jgi:hypothetical protein